MKLHITNGDSAGDMLKASSVIKGDVLCWRDVLHDGPIPCLDGDSLYQARAKFISSVMNKPSPLSGPELTEATILANFQERQRVLDDLDRYDEIVLWFEHDLYDQLQLAECLYLLQKEGHICDKTTIICIGEHSEIPFFHGLGNLTINQMEALFPQREPLTMGHLYQGSLVWSALAQPRVDDIADLLDYSFSSLPFMRSALGRFAEEFPSIENGLTRTQQLILRSIAEPLPELPLLKYSLESHERAGRLASGVTAEQRYQQIMSSPQIRFGRLFINLQMLEPAPFMGDAWVMSEIERMAHGDVPYIYVDCQSSENWDLNASYLITKEGKDALAGQRHWLDDNTDELWRGGVHITSQNRVMWDADSLQFVLNTI